MKTVLRVLLPLLFAAMIAAGAVVHRHNLAGKAVTDFGAVREIVNGVCLS